MDAQGLELLRGMVDAAGGLAFETGDAPVEHLDFGYVSACSSASELSAILATLKSGKHDMYPQLIAATERRLLAVLAPADRARYLATADEPTPADTRAAGSAVESWLANEVWPPNGTAGDSGTAAPMKPPRVAQTIKGSAVQQSPIPHAGVAAVGTREAAAAAPSVLPARTDVTTAARTTAPLRREHKALPFKEQYGKWESYDVEGALRLAEAGGPELPAITADNVSTGAISSNSPSFVPTTAATGSSAPATPTGGTPPVTSASQKPQGDSAFRGGDYREADRLYTSAIGLLESGLTAGTPAAVNAAVLFANRAQALIKLGAPLRAVDDCSSAVALDPLYVKAWVRRATARLQVGGVDHCRAAVQDLERARELDGALPTSLPTIAPTPASSAAIEKTLASARAALGQAEAAAAAAAATVATAPIAAAGPSPIIPLASPSSLPAARLEASSQPSRRMVVEEVEELVPIEAAPTPPAAAAAAADAADAADAAASPSVTADIQLLKERGNRAVSEGRLGDAVAAYDAALAAAATPSTTTTAVAAAAAAPGSSEAIATLLANRAQAKLLLGGHHAAAAVEDCSAALRLLGLGEDATVTALGDGSLHASLDFQMKKQERGSTVKVAPAPLALTSPAMTSLAVKLLFRRASAALAPPPPSSKSHADTGSGSSTGSGNGNGTVSRDVAGAVAAASAMRDLAAAAAFEPGNARVTAQLREVRAIVAAATKSAAVAPRAPLVLNHHSGAAAAAATSSTTQAAVLPLRVPAPSRIAETTPSPLSPSLFPGGGADRLSAPHSAGGGEGGEAAASAAGNKPTAGQARAPTVGRAAAATTATAATRAAAILAGAHPPVTPTASVTATGSSSSSSTASKPGLLPPLLPNAPIRTLQALERATSAHSRGTPLDLFHYLRRNLPADPAALKAALPALCKRQVESDVVAALLGALAAGSASSDGSGGNANEAGTKGGSRLAWLAAALEGVAAMPGFGTVSLMFGKEEKQAVAALAAVDQHNGASDGHSDSSGEAAAAAAAVVAMLRRSYGLRD